MNTLNNECNPCTKKNAVKHIACEHRPLKSQCVICEGNEICQHKKRRTKCIDCNACVHQKLQSRCRLCGDVIKKIINGFIGHSKFKDKKYNRFDIVNFIDRDFLKLLIE